MVKKARRIEALGKYARRAAERDVAAGEGLTNDQDVLATLSFIQSQWREAAKFSSRGLNSDIPPL